MKHLLLISILFFLFFNGRASNLPISSDADHPKLIYTQEQIDFIAEKISEKAEPWYSAYNNLISIANSYSNRKHGAVAVFHTPPFYEDKEDNIDAKSELALDVHAAHANALAYVLNGNETYARKAIYFLNAWANINKTILEEDSEGEATGTVLTASNLMSEFLIAADLLLGQSIWPENEKNIFKSWVETVYRPSASSIKTKSNNWGNWGNWGTAASCYILKDKTGLKTEINRLKEKINNNQNADGSLPQETRRENNGLWYTYFALVPTTMTARLALNTTGENFFSWVSEDGRSIKKALDYLYYYIFHKSEWPWYDMKDSTPSKDSPCDLFEAMNQYYNNQFEGYTKLHRPVRGGYKGNRVSHTGWSFPTLMLHPSTVAAQKYVNSENSTFYIKDDKIYFTNANINQNEASLYDLYGRCLQTTMRNSSFDISGMPIGIYVLKINRQNIKIMIK